MLLVCHVKSQEHLTKKYSKIMSGGLLKVSHHPAKFGGHRHCGS